MAHIFFKIALAVLLVSPALAQAESACDFGVEPTTSGFPLNPILDKLTITSAKPSAPGKTCSLMVGDQILELDQHSVVGVRALKVHGYFKGVKDGALYTLKVKRGASLVVVSTR